jgi:hypothetical protein
MKGVDSVALDPGSDGIMLNAGTSSDPHADQRTRRVYWITPSGRVVASAYGWTDVASDADLLELQAGFDLGDGHPSDAIAYLVAAAAGNRSAFLRAHSNAPGNLSTVDAFAGDGTVGRSRKIIDSAGASDLVYTGDESLRAVRGQIGRPQTSGSGPAGPSRARQASRPGPMT